MKTLPDRIRALLKHFDLNQTSFSSLVGMKHTVVIKWLSGETAMPQSTAMAFQAALGVRQFLKHVEQITDAFETIPNDYAEADEAGKVAILRDLCNGFTYKDGEIIPTYKDTFALFINSKAYRQKPRLRKSALKIAGEETRTRVWVRDSSTMRPLLEEYRTLLAA